MGSIDRYIIRSTLGAFLVILVSLTALIWVTQALHDIDLITTESQTILTFIGITAMIVPLLVLVIAPIALVIAVAFVLNRMSTDSELIILNASGMSPWRMFFPFLISALIVAIFLTFVSAWLAPKGLRELRDWLTTVRAGLVSYIVEPGRFTTIENGLTFHIRERRPSGQLLGVFVDDRRDPQDHVTVIAERGEIVKSKQGTFLLLQNGSVQRHESTQPDPSIVVFDRYAFDLSRYDSRPDVKYSVRERYLWELIDPAADDEMAKSQPGQFRAELNDRLLAPLYPIVFVVLTFAFLGAPRTTRQSRGMSLLSAILLVAAVRLIGFASTVVGVHFPPALAMEYIAVVAALVFGAYAISRGVIIEPPARITEALAALGERIAKRTNAIAMTS